MKDATFKQGSTFTLPLSYWPLEKALLKFSGAFSFCPRSRILLKITGNKHSASYMLGCLLDLLVSKDTYLTGWHKGVIEKNGRTVDCLFLKDEDLSSLLGMPRYEHLFKILKKLGFIQYIRTKTQCSDKFGRRIHIRLQNITKACDKAFKDMCNDYPPCSKNLMCKSRATRAQDFDLYAYHDVLTKRIERVYTNCESEFLKMLTDYNMGKLSHAEYRAKLDVLDYGLNMGVPTCTEPATIEWAMSNYEKSTSHARKRMDETAAIFASIEHGAGKANWYAHGKKRESVISSTATGNFDLFTMQFIGVALVLRPKLKEHFNIKNLTGVNYDVDSLFAGVCEVWEQDTGYTGETTDKHHPNTLIINELKSIGWLECQVKYKYVSGKRLLDKWLKQYSDYCDISLLQRLCIYGKMFPDAKDHIKLYSTIQDKEKGVPHAIACLKKLTAKQLRLYTAMYPNTLPDLIVQANAYTE